MNDGLAESRADSPGPIRTALPFPVAGIGVSAGGLAATIQLLQILGAEPGMAFVLVSHLDPVREGSLVDILAGATPMPVRPARDGDAVEPNHLYVVAPNTEVVIAGGVLRLVPRAEGDRSRLPIDRFFRALADDQGRLSIGIVLSGTESEGSASAGIHDATLTEARDYAERLAETVRQSEESDRKIIEYQEKLQRMAFDATVAEERERRRIALDLHDRIGLALAAARMKMVSACEGTSGEARDAIEQALELVAQTIADTRTLMFDLSPPVLYDLGFREALSWLAEDVEGRHQVHVEIMEGDAPPPLDETTAAILFRCVRELLMNVVKHSGAGHAQVSLRTNVRFEIEVTDEGRGFDPETATRSGGSGFGLFSVREQMSRLRGTLEIAAVPSRGARVTLRVPIAAATPSELPVNGVP